MSTELRALEVRKENHIAEVTLIGPSKGNAMGPDLWRELPRVFDDLSKDTDVRAIIVTGRGENFTYGLDLPGMMGSLGPALSGDNFATGRTKILELVKELQGSINAVENCKKPVIAAIAGYCIGGGVDLISACDVRVCTQNAKFSVREVKVAMVADLGSLQRLPRIIGHGHTRELAYSGKDIDAERALRIGLVNDVYQDKDAMLAGARALATEIANNSPLVVQGVKQVLNFSEEQQLANGLRYVAVWNAAFLQSKDLAEALTAFMQKRPPKFTGE